MKGSRVLAMFAKLKTYLNFQRDSITVLSRATTWFINQLEWFINSGGCTVPSSVPGRKLTTYNGEVNPPPWGASSSQDRSFRGNSGNNTTLSAGTFGRVLNTFPVSISSLDLPSASYPCFFKRGFRLILLLSSFCVRASGANCS